MEALKPIKKMGYACERCGYEWAPRKKEVPRYCPKCHSPYWNKKRERGLAIEKFEKTGKKKRILAKA